MLPVGSSGPLDRPRAAAGLVRPRGATELRRASQGSWAEQRHRAHGPSCRRRCASRCWTTWSGSGSRDRACPWSTLSTRRSCRRRPLSPRHHPRTPAMAHRKQRRAASEHPRLAPDGPASGRRSSRSTDGLSTPTSRGAGPFRVRVRGGTAGPADPAGVGGSLDVGARTGHDRLEVPALGTLKPEGGGHGARGQRPG